MVFAYNLGLAIHLPSSIGPFPAIADFRKQNSETYRVTCVAYLHTANTARSEY